jgi:hypothetical protein
MPQGATKLNAWIGVSLLGALAVAFAAGWWLGHREQPVQVDPGSQPGPVQAGGPADDLGSLEKLRAENDDLRQFIDEVYALLAKEGIHIQLDLEIDENGHYRLKADSAKLLDSLKATLQEINQNRTDTSTDN